MILYITKSKRKNKKYDLLDSDKSTYYRLVIQDIKTTLCIKMAIEKTTIYPGTEKKIIVLKNIKSAAFMSAHLLWGKPTLQASISDVNKRFNINVKLI